MSKYFLRVPVTTYHEVAISDQDIIDILEEKKSEVLGQWDDIYIISGVPYYYKHG